MTPALVPVVARPHPFRTGPTELELPAGLTLAQMLEVAQPDPLLRCHAVIFVDDWEAPVALWGSCRPRAGRRVTICVRPAGGGGGGKSVLRIIAQIAVLAAAIAVPHMAAFGGTMLAAGTVGGALLSAGIGVVGSLLVNALIPPPRPKLGRLGTSAESPTYFLQGARNQPRPFAAVPLVLGQHRTTPPLGALTYTELVGDDQYLRLLVVWGHGPLQVTGLRIGETPIGSFAGVEVQTRQGTPGEARLTLFPNTVLEEALSILLEKGSGWRLRTSAPEADEISLDLTFPRGLVRFDEKGERQERTVQVQVQSRAVGGGAWTDRGTVTVTARQAGAIRRGLRFAVSRGQHEVRLRRLTRDATDDRIVDEVHWTALRTIRTEEPIALGGLARTAVRIKASDELAGVVDQLNGIVHSILPDWDATSQSWITRPTRSPASLFRAVIQGPGNARPLPNHRVDLDGLAAWHQHCAQHGFRADLVVDFEASVFEILSDIAAAGRATPTLIDGRWSVAIDRLQSTPVQHFTPRNSWGFRAEKAFPELPHAFRVRFANRDAGWSQDERLVYDDGFDAVRIEALELPGITEPALVHKHARYHIASARLRPEVYSWFADIEHIVCRKGDLVAVAHDVPLWGLNWGRVRAVLTEDGAVTGVLLDEEVLMEAGKSYVARFRLADGQRLVRELVTAPGTTRTVTFAEPLPPAEAPEPGDLFMFGELGREVAELVVKAIERGPALTARIVAVDAAPAINTADQSPIPPFDSRISVPPGTLAPLITDIRSDEAVLFRDTDGALRAQIVLSLHHDGARPLTRIAGIEARYRLAGSSGPWRMASADADAREIGLLEVGEGETWRIRARYRYRDGSHGPWTQLFTHTVVGLGTAPPDVPEAYVEDRTLLWRYPAPPPDFAGFRLRHRSGNRTSWGQGAPAHEGLITVTAFDLDRLPGGTRTVMIRAVDVGGNESDKPAVVVLQLGDVLQDNVIEEDDLAAAGFPGTIVNADVVDGELLASDTALYLADPDAPYLPNPDGPYLPGDYLPSSGRPTTRSRRWRGRAITSGSSRPSQGRGRSPMSCTCRRGGL